ERAVLDDTVRAQASGSFVRLADGYTHYELAGPARGPVVLLVHGLSVPYYLWDDTVGPLHTAGLRTLRLDLYGRGLSDRPEAVHNLDLYDRQLVGLLDALNLKEPVHLVGISMGGAIAVNFAVRHPERLAKLGLIAPFGFPQETGASAALVRTPLLGEWM